MSLTVVRDKVLACKSCGLRETCRAPVPGAADVLAGGARYRVYPTTNTPPRIVLIGEAPGEREDDDGQPFVGASGQVLTSWLVRAGNPDVYITNTVKCRPPSNRQPTVDEKAACRPHLDRELEAIKPRVIVGFGRHAAMSMLRLFNKSTGMKRLVEMSTLPYDEAGQWMQVAARMTRAKVLVAYHPSYYLQSGRWPEVATACVDVLKRAIELAEEPA